MNQKLFNLGNDMVALHRKIAVFKEKSGPYSIPFLEAFEDLIEIVNTIRMECAYPSKKKENICNFKVTVPCTQHNLDKVVHELQKLMVDYEIRESEVEE